MDVDVMTTEKRTALMRKGACFICEELGCMAKDHNEHIKKKKANVRGTSTATPTTASFPKPKTVKEIHTLLQVMTTEQTKELLALQNEGQEKEDDSDF